jgi:uncharacterized membrane protein AbrB (regulator of aidB expression)
LATVKVPRLKQKGGLIFRQSTPVASYCKLLVWCCCHFVFFVFMISVVIIYNLNLLTKIAFTLPTWLHYSARQLYRSLLRCRWMLSEIE